MLLLFAAVAGLHPLLDDAPLAKSVVQVPDSSMIAAQNIGELLLFAPSSLMTLSRTISSSVIMVQ